MENNSFSRKIQSNYNLQNKHLFKKRTGNANGYYELFFDENLENDLKALHYLYSNNIPFKIFGLHTNIYITDNGYNGLFVDISPKNDKIIYDEKNGTFKVTSNVLVSKFVNYTMKIGYDFSSFTGIPGFVGAGVVGNSGFSPTGKSFSDYVQEITVYDFEKDKIVKFKPDDNFFCDRDSYIKKENRYKTRFFVKEVILKSDYIGEIKVREKYKKQIKVRENALRYGYIEGTAGSLWSNAHLKKEIGKSFTDMLIENPSINSNFNGATYSSNGIMFFTTSTETKDKDVAKLFIHTIEKVRELYGIELHKEVLILDSDGEIDLNTFIKRNS